MATADHDLHANAHAAADPAHAADAGNAAADLAALEQRIKQLIAVYGTEPEQLAKGIVATHSQRDPQVWTALQQSVGNATTTKIQALIAKHHVAKPTLTEVMSQELELDGPAIDEASAQYGVPADEIRAIITQESRGDDTANAGRGQHDHGKHAASGLMQVTQETWKQAQHSNKELAGYDFATYRYDRRINILVGTAVLAAKRRSLVAMGIDPKNPHLAELTSMAYNAGEGLVAEAYRRARHGGSKHPEVDCLLPAYLKPAIHSNPEVYGYYLTGAGKSRNPDRTVERAVDLKFEEISRYPAEIVSILANDAGARDGATNHLDDFDGTTAPKLA